MRKSIRDKKSIRSGFTLIEVAISLGVLGILTLVVAALLLRTTDTYTQVATNTNTAKQARHCLEMISREVRESANFSIVNPVAAGQLASVTDALLLTSARRSDGVFALDADNFPIPQSIVLFYINALPNGNSQLVRHQLYYAEDLNAFAPPFVLAAAPYSGVNINIVDNLGQVISIDRTTGTVGGTPSFRSPRILMNETNSLDLVNNGIDPIEIRVTCQDVDRNGRAATTRLSTQVEPRNL